jgi:hypothetical protein
MKARLYSPDKHLINFGLRCLLLSDAAAADRRGMRNRIATGRLVPKKDWELHVNLA